MKIKTYSEDQGKKAFDWNKALSAKSISGKKWDKLLKKAGDWVTCACGNQCAILPRYADGEPKDQILSLLGGIDGFFGAIRNRDKENAIDLLAMIETRSEILIRRLSK
jgi:hypothetical protein